ncbi:hypothetical protein LCGC14_2847930 [marine sediment metagenome]|uniref:Uncharacterized protein n=1 Tax=marine sediment metagenome TaxID=412755 RepID=A0A0F8Y9C6_9ZZZZ
MENNSEDLIIIVKGKSRRIGMSELGDLLINHINRVNEVEEEAAELYRRYG